MTVTFETKVYQNDWEILLTGNYLSRLIKNCKYPFNKKILFINNVSDLNRVKKSADRKVNDGTIDCYYVVEDFSTAALDFFDIDKQSFEGGYPYSIAELVSIYLCETEYLMHFSSDSFMPDDAAPWIQEALDVFDERRDVIVANPTWNFAFHEAKNESFETLSQFYLGYGFSDQCYLIRTNIFKDKIYNQTHSKSERYPSYGGELFEKRVDSFMRHHHYYRITSKHVSYVHKNFRKEKIRRTLNRLLRGSLAEQRFSYSTNSIL